MKLSKRIMNVCLALLTAYLVTAVLLAGLAVLYWKTELSQGIVKIIILVLYLFSAGAGGYAAGKLQKEKKYIWGFLVGLLYFVLLLIMNFLSVGLNEIPVKSVWTVGIICVMSGALGGMIA